MSDWTAHYRDGCEPGKEPECPSCIAWYAEAQRATLLLERLAEDRFSDQAAFDRWVETQMAQVFRG